jgi:hypothetical protein
MGNSKQLSDRVASWIEKYHVQLVVVLAVLHIGLACMQVRDSGRADPQLAKELEFSRLLPASQLPGNETAESSVVTLLRRSVEYED